jgi:hypothetical protein
MELVLSHLNVVVLFVSGVAVAVVLFVAIGLLIDLVPRESEKPSAPPRHSWLWRFFHLGLSH